MVVSGLVEYLMQVSELTRVILKSIFFTETSFNPQIVAVGELKIAIHSLTINSHLQCHIIFTSTFIRNYSNICNVHSKCCQTAPGLQYGGDFTSTSIQFSALNR